MLTNLATSGAQSSVPFGDAVLPAVQSAALAALRDEEETYAFGEDAALEAASPRIEVNSRCTVTRRTVRWGGMAAEIVETAGNQRAEFHLKAPVHLLAIWHRGARQAGETFVEGLPPSGLRDLTGRISFVPAGHEYREWQEPKAPTRTIFVYLDPARLKSSDLHTPRLLFEDDMLLAAALSLMSIVENPSLDDREFLEALGVVLVHALQRLDRGSAPVRQQPRGGLAAWQQRAVAAYIEEHLAEPIPLAELAQLARLSPFHFSRAFKQSFGMPPHRYHITRRIERAKMLLLEPEMTVTEVGLTVGFSETSGFTATFRRLTGLTPTGFARSHSKRPE